MVWREGAHRAIRLGAALGLALLTTCVTAESAPTSREDDGNIIELWEPAADPAQRELSSGIAERAMFEQLVGMLDGTFKLPSDLTVIHRSCDTSNAYYRPTESAILLCYEFLWSIAEVARADASLSDAEIEERIVGTWTFVFFHELGHALIDLYDIPVTGREEDAVDDFSTLLLLDVGHADYAISAAGYWGSGNAYRVDEHAYADEHSLNAQRFYAILCLVYGSDPPGHPELVTPGPLSTERAASCIDQYAQTRRSWTRLLEAWTK